MYGLRHSLLFLLLIFAQFLVWSQPLSFEHLGKADGLSDGAVWAFEQDTFGFIWIGTENGLNRYDGHGFKIFKHDAEDSTSLSNNTIKDLLVDSRGNLWIGTENGLNRFRYETEDFEIFTRGNSPKGLTNSIIRDIMEDRAGNLWFGTGFGINKMDPSTQLFTHFIKDSKNPKSLSDGWVNEIYEDQLGYIWVSTGGGLNRLNPTQPELGFTRFLHVGQERQAVTSIVEDPIGNFWLATYGSGMFQYIRSENRFVQMVHDPNDPSSLGIDYINKMFLDRKGRLWLATEGAGLDQFDYQTKRFSHSKPDPFNSKSISNNAVRGIFEDQQGNLWVGNTIGGGINLVQETGKEFISYTPSAIDPNSLSGEVVTTFFERSDGNLWVGTDGGGLNYFEKSTGKFYPYRRLPNNPNSLNGDKVQCVLETEDGTVWVSAWNGGVTRFKPNPDPRNPNTRYVRYNYESSPTGIRSQDITSIIEDVQGTIWISHGLGIDRYNAENDTWKNFRSDSETPGTLSNNAIWNIYVDKQGTMWVATRYGGLNKYDRQTETFSAYRHDKDDLTTISSNEVYAMLDDSQGRFWVGTIGGGLNLMDRNTGTFKRFGVKEGLPSERVVSLEEGQNGTIWMGTSEGLVMFDPEKNTFRLYTKSEGVVGTQFSRASSMRDSDGLLYFGAKLGFNVFDPAKIQDNTFIPPVVITDLEMANKRVGIGEKNGLLEKSISLTPKIQLNHNQNVISIFFAGLNYVSPRENQYAFMLEGFDKDWRFNGNENKTTYTNLNPGTYTFRVKASNNDDIWNESGTSLELKVKPAPWLSTWAFVGYFLLLLGAFLLWRQQLLRQQSLKNSLNLRQLEAEKLQEIDQLKSRFFANISHEFRTPLTVILGMTDQVLDKMPDVNLKELRKSMNLVRRNGSNLLQLVNQLLDLSKLEANEIKPNWVIGDAIAYVRYLAQSFDSYAHTKSIDYQLEGMNQRLMMDYDVNRLRDILTNLISNAIKFCPEGKSVTIATQQIKHSESEKEVLEIAVKDTGIGIPADQLDRIFDRFYQADNQHSRVGEGTGIGLALTKEMVSLLGGSIAVESTEGLGTTFRVLLPIHQLAIEHAPDWDKQGQAPVKEGAAKAVPVPAYGPDDERPLLLIVEDNADVVSFLVSCLDNAYRIEVATDGEQGIKQAVAAIPDIIISDVMMPKKNGYEVCEFLKQDYRTSHIPIILLTAKAAMDDKLEGLSHGADAYLTKPFHKDELFVRLEKLIELRGNLQQRYAKLEITEGMLKPASAKTQKEDEFVQKVRAAIEANLTRSDYSIESLCKEINMSRAQLHRKLVALTNKPTTHFIRAIRLQHALNYLQTSQLTVSEIAYEVGFNDPNYFSRVFTKEYGYPPSELRK